MALNSVMDHMNDSSSSQKPAATTAFAPQVTTRENHKEIELLKAKLAAMQAAHDVDMEGMETLIEAKIFREDELESELADAKRALAEIRSVATILPNDMNGIEKMKKENNSTLPQKERNIRERGETVKAGESRRPASTNGFDEEDDCEICGQPHPIEVCSRNPISFIRRTLEADEDVDT